MLPTLETARLVLRPLAIEDAEQTQELFPCWEIVRYLAKRVPWPYPPDGARDFYEKVALPGIQRGDQWHWTLRLKSEPEQLIGAISLLRQPNENRGFWMGMAWQGHGLMTEAVEAATGYWFGELGFPVLRAPKAVPNIASRRISEKTGMRLVGVEERDYVSGRFPTEIWEITKQEWSVWQSKKLP